MSESTGTKPPQLLLQEFLEQNNLALQVVVMAPKGGAVNPMNFVPDGWQITVQVVPNGSPQ